MKVLCLVIYKFVNVNVTKYNAAEMSKITDLWLSRVFFQALNRPKFVFGPRSGSLRRSPDPVVGWEGGYLRRLGCQPPTQNPGYANGSIGYTASGVNDLRRLALGLCGIHRKILPPVAGR